MAPSSSTVVSGLRFLNKYPRHKLTWKVGSIFIMSVTGLLSRAFLYGFHKVETSRLKEFFALLDHARKCNRGVLTGESPIFIFDDQPAKYDAKYRTMCQCA